jgi:hypothetical protein
MTQLGIILAGLLAIVIALFKRSIVDIWYDLGSISTASLLIPLASSFSVKWRMSREAAFWMGLGSLFDQERFLNIDPIYPGLFCSILFFIFDRYLFSHNSYK